MAGREDAAMWHDLAVLTPSLVVCVAFVIGLVMLLRREMVPKTQKRRSARNARRRSRDDRS